MINYNCKSCGCPLLLNGNEKTVNCQYCNTSFVLKDKETNVSVDDLLTRAQTAEQAENHLEALSYYNAVLMKDEKDFYALLGKAFASLAVFTYGKLNFKEFEIYFTKALQNKGEISDLTVHEIILDKIWMMLGYSANIATNIFSDKYSTNGLAPDEYLENLIALHRVQKLISNVVDGVDHQNITEMYRDCYLEFKNASIAHAEQIFSVAKRFGVKIDKGFTKELKIFIKTSEKELKIFKKKYC